ncbi:hypothetical protein RFI_31079, partial [Reticulomyxa filosa]
MVLKGVNIRFQRTRQTKKKRVYDLNFIKSSAKRNMSTLGNSRLTGTSPTQSRYVARITGIPFSSTERDIVAFFRDENIVYVKILVDKNGRNSGHALVEFATQQDLESALGKDKQYIGQRYIDVKIASQRDVETHLGQVKGGQHYHTKMNSSISNVPINNNDSNNDNDDDDDDNPSSQIGESDNESAENANGNEQFPHSHRPSRYILKIKGLPFDVKASDLIQFFKQKDSRIEPGENQGFFFFFNYNFLLSFSKPTPKKKKKFPPFEPLSSKTVQIFLTLDELGRFNGNAFVIFKTYGHRKLLLFFFFFCNVLFCCCWNNTIIECTEKGVCVCDFFVSLSLDRQYVGQRYVELFKSNEYEMSLSATVPLYPSDNRKTRGSGGKGRGTGEEPSSTLKKLVGLETLPRMQQTEGHDHDRLHPIKSTTQKRNYPPQQPSRSSSLQSMSATATTATVATTTTAKGVTRGGGARPQKQTPVPLEWKKVDAKPTPNRLTNQSQITKNAIPSSSNENTPTFGWPWQDYLKLVKELFSLFPRCFFFFFLGKRSQTKIRNTFNRILENSCTDRKIFPIRILKKSDLNQAFVEFATIQEMEQAMNPNP